MNTLINFSAELRAWILHNLERGCAPDDLVTNMIAQRFEPALARGLIEVFIQARANGDELPSDAVTLQLPDDEYHYEAPRIAAGTSLQIGERTIRVAMRIERPVIAVLENVLDADECAQLIALAQPRLTPSTVVDPHTGANTIAEHRNSDGVFFAPGENPLLDTLDRRIAQLMNCPLEHGEGLQILRYGPGAQSTPHFDFLIPSNATNKTSLARSGQRISSLVIYLNDVIAGGETVFPEIDLAISPKRGNAVYFEYGNSRRQVDHRSLHAGAPVISGEKWVATKWMRERRFIPANIT